MYTYRLNCETYLLSTDEMGQRAFIEQLSFDRIMPGFETQLPSTYLSQNTEEALDAARRYKAALQYMTYTKKCFKKW